MSIPAFANEDHKTTIDRIVQTLAEKLEPDRIFYHRGSLLIAISGNNHRSLQDYKAEIDASCQGIHGFNYKTILCHELEQLLLQGHLFYSTVCASSNVVYNQSSGKALLPLCERISDMQADASKRFFKGLAKSQRFLDGAAFYFARKESDMAMFMIHQSAEQCLRGFIVGVSEQEIRSHSISDLRQQAARYSPCLSYWLPSQSHKQQQQFFLLEKAYSCSRYVSSYQVDLKEVAELFEHVKELIEMVEKEFRTMLKNFSL